MGSSTPSSQTVTQVQQIPQYEQDFSQANQNLAASLASTPYPQYQGALIAPLDQLQNQGISQATQAAGSYQPDVNAAVGTTNNAIQMGPQQWNDQTASQYMSPYVSAALQPQVQQLQNQLGQEQNQAGAAATSEGAFGDARQGVANSLNNFNANLSMNDLLGQGYNSAYTSGQQAFQNANQNTLAEQQAQLAGGQQFGNLGSLEQTLGLTGANAVYSGGLQQQTTQQQELNEAYQQFQNQVNWPYQQLNVDESAISNNPYTLANSTTLPQANMTASNIGSFSSLAGLLGSLGGSGSSSTSNKTF